MPDVENVIEPILAAYIDQKKLQRLLEKIFGQEIVVYVSGQHLLAFGRRAHSAVTVADYPCHSQKMRGSPSPHPDCLQRSVCLTFTDNEKCADLSSGRA